MPYYIDSRMMLFRLLGTGLDDTFAFDFSHCPQIWNQIINENFDQTTCLFIYAIVDPSPRPFPTKHTKTDTEVLPKPFRTKVTNVERFV